MPCLSDLSADTPFPLSTTPNWQLIHVLDKQGRLTAGQHLTDVTAELNGHAENPHGLRITDNTMQHAGIGQNAIVIMDPTLVPRDGQIVLAQLGDQVLCRRLRQGPGGGRLTTESANSPDLVLADNPLIRILGVVVSVVTQHIAP